MYQAESTPGRKSCECARKHKKAQSCKVGIASRTCSRCWCSERGWCQFKACTGFEGLLLKILVYDGSLGNASFSVKEGKDLSEIFRNWRMTAVREWKPCEDNVQDLQCIEILSDKFEQEKRRDTVMKRAHRRIAASPGKWGYSAPEGPAARNAWDSQMMSKSQIQNHLRDKHLT